MATGIARSPGKLISNCAVIIKPRVSILENCRNFENKECSNFIEGTSPLKFDVTYASTNLSTTQALQCTNPTDNWIAGQSTDQSGDEGTGQDWRHKIGRGKIATNQDWRIGPKQKEQVEAQDCLSVEAACEQEKSNT